MKKDILEYYPNGSKKHIILYHPNGNKSHEQFYDESGYFHRDGGIPDYQSWFDNGITSFKTYHVHDKRHNINNPSVISFFGNGRFLFKSYWLNNYNYSKLNWMNCIKNI